MKNLAIFFFFFFVDRSESQVSLWQEQIQLPILFCGRQSFDNWEHLTYPS